MRADRGARNTGRTELEPCCCRGDADTWSSRPAHRCPPASSGTRRTGSGLTKTGPSEPSCHGARTNSVLRETKGGAVTGGLRDTWGWACRWARRLSHCAPSLAVASSEKRDCCLSWGPRDCPRTPAPAKVAGAVQPSADPGPGRGLAVQRGGQGDGLQLLEDGLGWGPGTVLSRSPQRESDVRSTRNRR